MRKFMLITNRYKDRDLTLSNEIVSYIQQKGGSAAICVSNVEDDNQKDFALSEIPADTECILVLGGDGTLIRAATLGHWGICVSLRKLPYFMPSTV